MSGIQQRIAQIIRQVDGDHSMGAAALAEALVSELGLRQERSAVLRGLDGNYRQVWPHRIRENAKYGFRYVTEWVPE